MMASVLALLKLLPMMLDLAKQISALIDAGYTELQVRDALKKIDKAFVDDIAKERARRLNDVFRKE